VRDGDGSRSAGIFLMRTAGGPRDKKRTRIVSRSKWQGEEKGAIRRHLANPARRRGEGKMMENRVRRSIGRAISGREDSGWRAALEREASGPECLHNTLLLSDFSFR